VLRLVTQGGYAAVDAAFADPPDSTEQILHPDKYLTREAPVEVKVPAGITAKLGAGWSQVGQDTLGEAILRIWLKIGGATPLDANKAAAGWGGDRLALYRGPSGELVVVLVTEWDSIGDAEEFAGAAAALADAANRGMPIEQSGTRTALAIGNAKAGSAVSRALEAVLGALARA
jgi:hypothetical protein